MVGSTVDDVGRDLAVFRRVTADLRPSGNEIFEGGRVVSCDVGQIAASVTAMQTTPVRSALVRFDPGARTRLHTHAGDQILIVTEGQGHVGRPGRNLRVEVGDVVVVPAGLLHYHGAGRDMPMAHLTVLFGVGTELADGHPHWPPAEGEDS
ncbi:cupin domain-containing protein [Micromonospora inyonensis]|uniref:Cupin domain-containing protein n=1 Tax=Micromonospora inyonensis TaxID=47866 RepID=A0A1C6SI41_9ACTN|nr:cupin domain-containing protein [Micromonospora inyonensis]SCL29048.1 Cupin domain-containing protein [Micromonospora inyonensis]